MAVTLQTSGLGSGRVWFGSVSRVRLGPEPERRLTAVRSVPQYAAASEDLRSVPPGGHQLLHRRRRLRGGGRHLALPGAAQQAPGVHGDIKEATAGLDL